MNWCWINIFGEIDASKSISIGWHFRTAHGRLSSYKTNFMITASTKQSKSLSKWPQWTFGESTGEKKVEMNGKLLSGFLCVLLIVTFQVENSDAVSPGRAAKRSEEVREEISWIHSHQIISYQACRHTKSYNGYFAFQFLPPSIKMDNSWVKLKNIYNFQEDRARFSSHISLI